jgi:hypothetical protein
VAKGDTGVLLCGASGAGKSTLAYACARAGWTYVGDDATWLLPDSADRVALGRQHLVRFRDDVVSLFPEVEGYITSARPNGKLTIEVPLRDFPDIRTASRTGIGCVVFLERQPSAAASAHRIPGGEVVDRLMADLVSYGEENAARFERTLERLNEVPAYRLTYGSLDEAVGLLTRLAELG